MNALSVGGSRRRLLAGMVAGAALAAAGLVPSTATAAFTTGKCLGESNWQAGRGASFAASAHRDVWIPALANFCVDVGTTPALTYDSQGSGSGRRVMGERTNGAPEGDNRDGTKSRNQVPRFGMSEEPPSQSGQSDINAGTDAIGDEGVSRLIPAAMGAVAVVVNVPNGCDPYTNANGTALSTAERERFSHYEVSGTTPPAENGQRRLRLTRAQLEGIFEGGDLDTWGELVPNINDGNGVAGEAGDVRCQQFPIVRVRRLDDGGTTFVFKDYLSKIDPAQGWKSTYVSSPDTRNWPNAAKTVAWDYNNDGDTLDSPPNCASASADPVTGAQTHATTCTESSVPLLQTTDVLAASGGNGNDNLVDKVSDFDGAVGYGDLSTARQQRSFAFERQSGADDRYWVQLQTKCAAAGTCATPATQSWADPQSAPSGFRTGGARGANCGTAQLTGVPGGNDPTVANWENVSAADSSPTGYGACSLTYFIAFDDYSGPYSAQADQAAEERKARTVRDYIEHTVSSSGQSGLGAFDYGALPLATQTLALDAARRIGWQKSAGTNTGGGTATTTPPTTTGAGTPSGGASSTPPVVLPTPASNRFTISSARLRKGKIVVTTQIPGPGALRAVGTVRRGGRTLSAGSAGSTARAGGVVRLILTPSRAVRSALKRSALRATIVVTYAPTGGREASQRKTLRLAKTRVAKKKRSRS